MKKIIPILVVIVVIGGIFFALNSKPPLSQEEVTQIVQHQYVKNPIFAVSLRDNGDTYIVSAINDGKYNEPRLLVLKQVADLWQEQSPLPEITCSSLECPTDAKVANIGGNSYAYFTTISSGSAAGSVTFNLLSPSTLHVYTLSVSGGNGNYNQLGTVPEDVKSNDSVYRYLTQQIAESSKVAHAKDENLNVNDPTNAVQKWQLDNENIWTGMMNYAAPVKFTYYDEDLNSQWNGTSVTGSIENSSYKITSYFKGVAIGYDKAKGKYFILWVPSDMYEWPTDIAFVDANTVHINSANQGPSFTVHLDTNTISTP